LSLAMSDRKPSSVTSTSWYSIRVTIGSEQENDAGQMDSSFLPVKISTPVNWHLAAPCLPTLALEQSTTLQGFPLIRRKPPLRTSPPAMGTQLAAPESAVSKSPSESDICGGRKHRQGTAYRPVHPLPPWPSLPRRGSGPKVHVRAAVALVHGPHGPLPTFCTDPSTPTPSRSKLDALALQTRARSVPTSSDNAQSRSANTRFQRGHPMKPPPLEAGAVAQFIVITKQVNFKRRGGRHGRSAVAGRAPLTRGSGF